MCEDPKISVIVGSYNFEEFIAEALESLLNQTLKPFEIIIGDDHSTDKTWDIIQYFAKLHPDIIRAFRHEKRQGHLKNGIFMKDQVCGELYSEIDGDDRWLPEKLEAEWDVLKNNPGAKIIYSNVYTIDHSGKRIGIWYDGNGPEPPSGDLFVQTFSKCLFNNTHSLFRNPLMYFKCVTETGYKENNPDLVHTDWDRKIRWAARYPILYSGKALVEYRIHAGGIHHKKSKKLFKSACYVVQKNKHLIEERSSKEINQIYSGINSLLKFLAAKLNEDVITLNSRNLLLTPPILVNSIPKAGTHLLTKLLGLMPGLTDGNAHIGHSTFRQFGKNEIREDNSVPIGVDIPINVPIEMLENAFQSIPRGTFGSSHIPYSEALAKMIGTTDLKVFLIFRDPRDIVVSHAKYISRTPNHPLHDLYQKMSFDQQMMTSILGYEGNKDLSLKNIADRVKCILPWINHSFACTIKYEKLVGPMGGGSENDQFEEIKKISKHLMLEITNSEIQNIGERIFGGTATFRKGIIGSWKMYFKKKHREAFQETAGCLLNELGYETNRSWVNDFDNANGKNYPSLKIERKDKNTIYGNNLIFIISQPRAGSTLLQRILSGHSEIYSTAEPWIMLHPLYALKNKGIFTEFDSVLAKQGLDDFTSQFPEGQDIYINALRQMGGTLYNRILELSGKKIFLDKTPRYYLIIPELKRVFPEAKFILLLRNPMAVFSSTLATWFQNDPQKMFNSPNYMDLTKGPLYLLKGLTHLKEDAIVVRYEDLVYKNEEQVRDLCRKLEIVFQTDMLNYGHHFAPFGRFGDSIGIKKHLKAVPHYVDKWIRNLRSPRLCEFSLTYMENLGSEVFNQMGYPYVDIQNKLVGQSKKICHNLP